MKKANRIYKRSRTKRAALCLIIAICLFCTACQKSGSGQNDTSAQTIEGELTDIVAKIYDGADLDAEVKEVMAEFVTDSLTKDNEQAILGTSDISYKEGVYSIPLVSSMAYQCVLLRVEADTAQNVMDTLKANADVNKWVCVSAETVLVENVGDLVLFVMSDKETAYALSEAFHGLQ